MSAHLSEARWFKSSHSGGSQECVEVAFIGGDAGIAIGNMAKYNADFGIAIEDAIKEFETSWKGNAADGSREYFQELVDGLNAQIEAIQGISDRIDSFAMESYLMAQTISALVQKMFDDAFLYFVFQAAAASLTSSVAGAPAGAAMQAAALRALGVIKQGIAMHGKFGMWFAASEGALGLVESGMNALLDFPELPGGAAAEGYDHPGAIAT
ncbi:DUF397 domain-containing protein [Nocardia sp. NPDC051750]|uniref:DUF397 domain-containing protein n=1 Tax=Nocardia sp. NPDC051750 TaxID=3364325 RepID=UPI00379EE7F9